MNRNYFKITFFTLLLALSFSSCADVPEQVKEEIEILDKNDVLENDGDNTVFVPEYQTLEEIQNSIDEVVSNNERRVRVIGKPCVPQGDTLPVFDITKINVNEQEAKEIFSYISDSMTPFLPCDPIAPLWYDSTKPIEDLYSAEKDEIINVKDKNWFNYGDGIRSGGFDAPYSLTVSGHNAQCNFFQLPDVDSVYNNLPIEKIFTVGYDESGFDEHFTMSNDEEWKISDAKKFAEDFYDSTFSIMPFESSFKVKEIIVRKLPDGKFGYEMTLQQIIEDKFPILAIDYLDYSDNDDFSSVLFGNTSYVWCTEPDIVNWLGMSGSYELKEKANEKLLSAESALDILSSSIAQQSTISVYMELGLALHISDSEYMNITKSWGAYNCSLQNGDYSSAEAIPYWLFYQPLEGKKPSMSGVYYMINAVTGELEIR